jgi:hypothetical protein
MTEIIEGMSDKTDTRIDHQRLAQDLVEQARTRGSS